MDGAPWLKVTITSSVGEVELSTGHTSRGYKLRDGVTGLALPPRSVESTPIPAGSGSAFRSQRFDEAEMYFPVSIVANGPGEVADLQRRLERAVMPGADDPVEITVSDVKNGTVRRRFAFYTEGLEGELGGQASHVQRRRVGLRFRALDPMWYGPTQEQTFQLTDRRKILLASGEGRIDRVNLHSNPGVEVSAAGFWQFGGTSGQTIARTTSGAFSGSGALLVTATGGSGTPHVLMPPWQAEASGVYQLAFQHRSSSGVERLRVQWWREMAGVFSYWAQVGTAVEVPTSDSWQRAVLDAPVVSPSGRFMAQIQLLGPDGDAASGEWTRLDEFLVESGQVGPYFDGSTASAGGVVYTWDGEPGLSSSRATRVNDVSGSTFLPIHVSESLVQGVRDIYISGDAPAWPVWTIRGPGEDLLIEHLDTGKRIFIEGEFGAEVVIDTRRQDITDMATGEDLWARASVDTELFPLTAGENRVRISLARTSPESLVTLRYDEQWMAGY